MELVPVVKSLFRVLLGLVIVVPLVLWPLIYFLQDKLLFMGAPSDTRLLNWARANYPDGEVEIKTPDGARLHGWFLNLNPVKPAPLLIYFGGNAENVLLNLPDCEHFAGWNLLLVNYRGYGSSQGDPGQKALFADALLLYDTFCQKPEVKGDTVVAMGRSLGCGVAVHLASQRELAGLILVSPFDSMRAVAQRHYPYVPVSWFLKHPFDSKSLAPQIKAPMLAIMAKNDRIIPMAHSRNLIAAWGGPVTEVVIPRADHNSLGIGDRYWGAIEDFLGSVRSE